MLQIKDKIKYVKENPMIGVPLGTIFTVADIEGTAIALEADIEIGGFLGCAKCIMSYDEYEKYFEKDFEKVIEPETKKNVWTEWREVKRNELNEILNRLDSDYYIIDYLRDYFTECLAHIETRNNGKKTDVRITFGTNKIKVTTTCNKVDTFDETKGIEVALIKAFAKQITNLATIHINSNY